MSPLSLEEISSPRQRAFREFLDFPARLYHGHPWWVPELRLAQRAFFDPARHPFWKHARARWFLARDGAHGRPVARLGVCLDDNHNAYARERTVFWGFWDTENDPEAARLLFDRARAWAREQGADRLRGPCNFTTNHTCGLLVEGFDALPYFMMPYNDPYYEPLVLGAGFQPCMDLLAFRAFSDALPERIVRSASRIEKQGKYRLRSLRLDRLDEELRVLLEIYNDAWSDNWGFIPMTEEEFLHEGKDLKSMVDPDLVLIVEEEEGGRAVGFSITLPNLNPIFKKIGGRLFPWGIFYLLWARRRVDSCRMITMGIRKAWHLKGLDSLLYLKSWQQAKRHGYREAELSWILACNRVMINTLQNNGATLYRKYRIYEEKIG